MIWVWLIPVFYVLISIPVGIHEARKELAEDLKNSAKGWYLGDGSPRRSEEERIRFLAAQNFWPAIGSGLMWPLMLLEFCINVVWDFSAGAIASNEIKAARKRADEAKTQAILDSIKAEEDEEFRNL